MAIVSTQVESADRAAWEFVQAGIGTSLGGKTIGFKWTPPDRALADKREPKTQSATHRPQLPIVTMHRIGLAFDWRRTLHPRRARLGYTSASVLNLRTARQPIPLNLTWQLDFWAEQQREIQALWERLLLGFRGGYAYTSVLIDDVWGSKLMVIFVDDMQDTSDVEQGSDQLVYRRYTATMRTEFWLFDTVYGTVRTVRDIVTELRDTVGGLWDELVAPQRVILGRGDAAHRDYSFTLKNLPVGNGTLVVGATVAGHEQRGFDDGSGGIAGPAVTGTVDYVTGALQLQFAGNVDAGAVIYCEHMQEI